MKRTRLLLLLVVAAMVATMAAPASAHTRRVIRGDMDLTLLAQFCEDERLLTWAGTVEIGDEVYGWADFPTADLIVKGDFFYFEEYWTIFTLDNGEAPSAEAACDPSRVVIDGTNKGIGTPWFTGIAWGTVGSVAENGPFDDVPVGSLMFWRGYLTEQRDAVPGDGFIARLRIIKVR